jgi:hypothetical protein
MTLGWVEKIVSGHYPQQTGHVEIMLRLFLNTFKGHFEIGLKTHVLKYF